MYVLMLYIIFCLNKIARNNDIFGYQKQKTAYTVSIDIIYIRYFFLNRFYISLKSLNGNQLLKSSLYPFHFTKACFFL